MTSIVRQFKDTDKDWGELVRRQNWQVFFYGGQRAVNAEERCRRAYDNFSTDSKITTVGLNRTEVDTHYEFEVTFNNSARKKIGFSKLNDELGHHLPDICENVVLDLTSLELDTTLYLLSFLRSRSVKNLVAIYLVPVDYPDHERGLDYQSIQQPRGYISLVPALAGERDAAHYVLLGFDKGRANRFIERYDWDWSRIHAVLGDPSYVKKDDQDGVQIALEANEDWLNRIDPKNLHRVPADEPLRARDFFRSVYKKHAYIDIVPLGPKPMLLGLLLFYWPLDEDERRRVRLLYDFPTPKQGCTIGISKCYAFDIAGLLE